MAKKSKAKPARRKARAKKRAKKRAPKRFDPKRPPERLSPSGPFIREDPPIGSVPGDLEKLQEIQRIVKAQLQQHESSGQRVARIKEEAQRERRAEKRRLRRHFAAALCQNMAPGSPETVAAWIWSTAGYLAELAVVDDGS